jgi:RNA polymerase sigma-70 factor (TIGR02943 family)
MVNSKEWVNLYGDYLYSIALLKTNHKEAAEDLVQETFLSAIKSLDTFRQESSEKTWLVAILKNKIVDYYRKKNIFSDVEEYLQKTDESFYDFHFQADEYNDAHWTSAGMPANWKTQTDEQLNQGEFYSILELCIQKMPPKLIPVFTARYVDEEDSDKICKDYEISPSNYWVMLHRAKLLMRKCMEQNWFGIKT